MFLMGIEKEKTKHMFKKEILSDRNTGFKLSFHKLFLDWRTKNANSDRKWGAAMGQVQCTLSSKKKKSVPGGVFCQTPLCKEESSSWEEFCNHRRRCLHREGHGGLAKMFDLLVVSSQNFEITSMTSST
jgi:hypothetical protein